MAYYSNFFNPIQQGLSDLRQSFLQTTELGLRVGALKADQEKLKSDALKDAKRMELDEAKFLESRRHNIAMERKQPPLNINQVKGGLAKGIVDLGAKAAKGEATEAELIQLESAEKTWKFLSATQAAGDFINKDLTKVMGESGASDYMATLKDTAQGVETGAVTPVQTFRNYLVDNGLKEDDANDIVTATMDNIARKNASSYALGALSDQDLGRQMFDEFNSLSQKADKYVNLAQVIASPQTTPEILSEMFYADDATPLQKIMVQWGLQNKFADNARKQLGLDPPEDQPWDQIINLLQKQAETGKDLSWEDALRASGVVREAAKSKEKKKKGK